MLLDNKSVNGSIVHSIISFQYHIMLVSVKIINSKRYAAL